MGAPNPMVEKEQLVGDRVGPASAKPGDPAAIASRGANTFWQKCFINAVTAR